MKSPSLWQPSLREDVGVTSNTKRRLTTMAVERYPDVDIKLAIWRVLVDGIDALEREDARKAEIAREARSALAVYETPAFADGTMPGTERVR